jgi:serine/threonine protein kinase
VATDTHLDREVALKVYHPQVMSGDGPKQLAREAALPARVGHPDVVAVLDVDPELGAVAMELLPGGSLKEWIKQSGPKTAGEALAMTEAVCRPLAAVHAAGIVHRDVKPANVLRRADGTPVLTDLGVALLPDEEHDPGVGTPAYMAPEQQTEREIDARADVYAVGVMLAEMLGGYPGPPGRVGDLIDQCLCESPGGRPRDAAELGRLVRAVLAAEEAPPEFAADLARIGELAG